MDANPRAIKAHPGGSSRMWRLTLDVDMHPGAMDTHPGTVEAPLEMEAHPKVLEAHPDLWTLELWRQGEGLLPHSIQTVEK